MILYFHLGSLFITIQNKEELFQNILQFIIASELDDVAIKDWIIPEH